MPTATDFESLPGKGVRGRVDGRTVVIGNRLMMEAAGINNLDELRPTGR